MKSIAQLLTKFFGRTAADGPYVQIVVYDATHGPQQRQVPLEDFIKGL